MTLVYAAAAAGRVMIGGNKIEFAAVAFLILAWLLVLWGTFSLRSQRAEFKTALYVAVVSLAALLGQGGIAFLHHRNNMEEQTFIQIDVMFFAYIALLCMMAVFRLMMKALSELSVEQSQGHGTSEWKGIWLVCLVVIFAGTVFLPVASMFSHGTAIILSAVTILIILVVEGYLCVHIARGYQALQKKR